LTSAALVLLRPADRLPAETLPVPATPSLQRFKEIDALPQLQDEGSFRLGFLFEVWHRP
jgi:hypothetical protein